MDERNLTKQKNGKLFAEFPHIISWIVQMSKTIFLHIGSHKTGTTYLQETMRCNAEILYQQGYLYRGKVTADQDEIGDSLQANLIADLRAFLQSDKVSFIISDENLCLNLHDNTLKLAKNLTAHANVKVVYYLREIVSYYLSFYKFASLWLCATDKIPRFSNLMEFSSINQIYLKSYRLLTQLSKIIPPQDIIVRRYEKNGFHGGTLKSDFFNIVGVNYDAFNHQAQKQNVSPNLEQAEKLLLIHRLTQNPTIRERAKTIILEPKNNCANEFMITIDELSFLEKNFADAQAEIEKRYFSTFDENASFGNHIATWQHKIHNSSGKRFLDHREIICVNDLVKHISSE